MKFDENYYKTLNYVDYLNREPRYIALAKEVAALLESLSIINKDSTILDYGCATGFLLTGLTKLGYTNCYGYDISEWAVQQAKSKGLKILDYLTGHCDLMFALDVFEHMQDTEIWALLNACQSDYLVARIPCAEKVGGQFHLEVSKKDPTHINCKTRSQWNNIFRSFGYKKIFPLKLLTIYDNPGVYSFMAIK